MINKFIINNTNIYFQEIYHLPILDIQLNFKAGSIYDGNLNGLANISMNMFGTKTKQSNEKNLINKINNNGIHINTEVNKNLSIIKIRILNNTKIVNNLIKVLEEIFTIPIFDSNILKREKKQILTNINYLNKQPQYLASLIFFKNLFKNNPYSHPTIGYKKSINKINIRNIKEFFNKYICANNLNICFVGGINFNQIEIISKELLNFLPKGKENTKNFYIKKNKLITIKKRFLTKQTSILIGYQVSIDIKSPLYFALKLGNYILGGNFNSLLFNKLREELGLVYNISSTININLNYGSFIISAQTSKPYIALKKIINVYNNFINKILNNKSILKSKKYIKGINLIKYVSNNNKLKLISDIANKNLPLNFFNKYIDNINTVTAKNIQKSFLKINKKNTIKVLVGNI